MPEQTKTDIVMQFVQKGGAGAVLAECALEKDPDDPFMEDFNPAPLQNYSDFFEVTKFSFGVQVKEEDKTKDALAATGSAVPKIQKPFDEKKAMIKGSYASWRSATDDEIKRGKVKYPLEFETFSFTKLIDSASPIFFDCCLRSATFDSATLVKRVSIDDNKPALGFLQMNFTDVLIIGLDWDDGGMVSETCKFICRGFQLYYRRQNFSGSLQGASIPVTWVPDTVPGGGR